MRNNDHIKFLRIGRNALACFTAANRYCYGGGGAFGHRACHLFGASPLGKAGENIYYTDRDRTGGVASFGRCKPLERRGPFGTKLRELSVIARLRFFKKGG